MNHEGMQRNNLNPDRKSGGELSKKDYQISSLPNIHKMHSEVLIERKANTAQESPPPPPKKT